MGKNPAKRGKKRSLKQQQSIAFDTDDDSDSELPRSELPRSAYEQERMLHIRSNQETLDKLEARLDMSEQPRNTDGAQKQPKQRCEPKPLHVPAAVPL
jgi:hypothetical protein